MKYLSLLGVFFIVLFLISGVSAGDSWSASDPPLRDVSAGTAYCAAAKAMFSSQYTYYHDTLAPNGDLNSLYHMERMFDGMEGVYEVTGDVDVANKLLDIALEIVDAGEDLNSDGFLDYCFRDADGTPELPCDDDPDLMCTYPWKAMRGPAKALRVAKTAGFDKTRPADYAKLQSFMLHDVIDKWLDLDGPGPDTGQGGSHTAGIDSRMAGILLDTYYSTGDPRMGEMAREWILWVATDMENESGAYCFDNWIKENEDDEAADTSHSNEIITILIEGFESGFLPYSFIEPLHNTWLEVMWNRNADDPLFSEYVDGSGDWSGPVVMGWMRLGQFKGGSQSVAGSYEYSGSYDYEYIQANGNLCRIYGHALTVYPLAYPPVNAYLAGSASSSAGTSGEVGCGGASCNLSGEKRCCTGSYCEYSEQYCGTTCSYTAVSCDGPEDCSGNACCGFFGTGWDCSGELACASSELQLCHNASDCPQDASYCCANTGLPGLYHAVCSRFDCSGDQTTTTTTMTSTTAARTSTTNVITTTTSPITSTTSPACAMQGNGSPCDTVTLTEVVSAINLWASGVMGLDPVLELITSWSDPESYPAS